MHKLKHDTTLIFNWYCIMHEVSSNTVQAAQKHALSLIEQAKYIADIAQKLKNSNSTSVELAQRLEIYSKTILEHANKSLDLAQSLESNPSVEVLSASIEEHIHASNAHIEAVKAFQKSTHYNKYCVHFSRFNLF